MFLDGRTIEHQVKHTNLTMFIDMFLLQGVPTKHLPNLKKKIVLQGPIGVAGLKGGRGTQGAPVGSLSIP